AVVVAVGIEAERVAVLAHVETEVLVEVLRRFEVRHREHEMVERVHPDRVAVARRRDISTNGGHLVSPGQGCLCCASITFRTSAGEPHSPRTRAGADAWHQ